jgi:hypothetical protein
VRTPRPMDGRGVAGQASKPSKCILVPYRPRKQNRSYYGDRDAFMTCCERWRKPVDWAALYRHRALVADHFSKGAA